MKRLKELKEKIEDNIFVKIAKIIVYIVVGLLLFVILVQKVSNNNLSIGGFRVFMIISNSMNDEYVVGDILIAKSASEDKINIGDNVVYMGEKNELKGLIITHKVVDKQKRDGTTYYITKGVANQIQDPEIRYDQIFGKVIYKTMFLSFLAKLMNKQLTYYLLFTIVAIIIAIEFVSSWFSSKDNEGEDDGGK